MNVNQKGVKGLIRVIDDLVDRGWYAFPAFDDHSPVDLVAMSPSGKIARLQIKYREKIAVNKTKESYIIEARSVVNGKSTPIDRSLIDGWALYMADRKEVIYISVDTMGDRNSITVDPTKNYGELDEWFKSAPC